MTRSTPDFSVYWCLVFGLCEYGPHLHRSAQHRACSKNQAQRSQNVFSLPGFTKTTNFQEAGSRLSKSTQVFPI